MTKQIKRALVLSVTFAMAACGHPSQPVAPLTPQVDGTLTVAGLSAPVRVIRDRWGVPHIYAANRDDLFFAQGFVQAQDRLFQMDLWRRASQGRLAEVLGANFIGRDAMTRRIQYAGDLEAEWGSYGPETKAIVTAFVGGVNAWVAVALNRLPEEFVAAGWKPETWRPEDLLTRTNAFVASAAAALGDVLRARLVNAVGPQLASELTGSRLSLQSPADLSLVNYHVADALRQVGTQPFFAASNAWAIDGKRSLTGAPLVANDPHRALEVPSPFFLVHLHAPAWNVAGATPPWLPGVMLGHNDRVAWGMTAFDADTQDLFVEHLQTGNPHAIESNGRWIDTRVIVERLMSVGRPAPTEFAREITPHGVSIAYDSEHRLGYSLRWSGSEPGCAAGLAALELNRARSWSEFRTALARWKMPTEEVIYADVDGNIGSQVAGLVPIRRGFDGLLPVSGWTGDYDWIGWRSLDDLPHAFNPASGYVASANGRTPRFERLTQLLSTRQQLDVERFRNMQYDVVSRHAERLIPVLTRARAARADVERARLQLIGWDRTMSATSAVPTLYASWERRLVHNLASRRLDSSLVDEFLVYFTPVLIDALTRPTVAWFGQNAVATRDRLLLDALAAAVDDVRAAGTADGNGVWGGRHRATFRHVLGVGTRAGRYNIGPFPTPGAADTLMATTGPGLESSRGAPFRAVYDVSRWDRSMAQNAPGQSGSPSSRHFRDLATPWTEGAYVPLLFSDQAVQENAETTLVLAPRGQSPSR